MWCLISIIPTPKGSGARRSARVSDQLGLEQHVEELQVALETVANCFPPPWMKVWHGDMQLVSPCPESMGLD